MIHLVQSSIPEFSRFTIHMGLGEYMRSICILESILESILRVYWEYTESILGVYWRVYWGVYWRVYREYTGSILGNILSFMKLAKEVLE